MLLSIALIVLGLLLLVGGGEVLLRGAVALATHLRLTPAVIGLTVVAAGTSVPELAVSVIAALQGNAAITMGNVVGSNIFNVTVVIGICALIRPLPIAGNTIKLEYPVMALVTLMTLALCQDGSFNRLDAALSIAVYVGFTAYMVSLVRTQMTARETMEVREEVESLARAADTTPGPWKSLLFIAAGVALLAGGAEAAVSGAQKLAQLVGLSDRIIALAILAPGTSLPEVVTSVVAGVRGKSEVAIGNAIGSSLFNLLGILGLSALVRPQEVDPAILASDNWWMLGTALLLFPLMRSGMSIRRWEGGVLVGTYATYLGLLLAK